jgi:hypothetical protein
MMAAIHPGFDVRCPIGDTPIPYGRGMVCDSCGGEIAAHHDRCPSCGAATGETSNAASTAGFPPPTMADRATDSTDATVVSDATDATVVSDTMGGADATEIVIAAADPIEFDEELFEPASPLPPPTADGEATPEVAAGAAAGAATTVHRSVDPAAAGGARDAPTATTTPVTAPVTTQLTTVFDGHADIAEHPPERDSFKVRLVFVFAFFGALAAVLVPAADIVDIRTTRPVDGISIGAAGLDDIATNLAVASYVGVGAMVLGGLIACWGFRWAAGLAGGAGLALVGWAALTIGLVEARIEVAEEVTRTSPVGFTLEVTRDLGYWLIVGVAAVGTLVFVASLRLSRTAGRPGFNPWIAAIGAVATLVLAAGPLLPVNGASFGDNFWLTTDSGLPVAFFTGRLGQVALIGVFGAIGFLLVRWYGLGFAAGTVSVATWMWFSSLAELGDTPIGIASRNPGATDTTPHAATTLGMVLTLVMLLAAAIAASVQHRRVYHR